MSTRRTFIKGLLGGAAVAVAAPLAPPLPSSEQTITVTWHEYWAAEAVPVTVGRWQALLREIGWQHRTEFDIWEFAYKTVAWTQPAVGPQRYVAIATQHEPGEWEWSELYEVALRDNLDRDARAALRMGLAWLVAPGDEQALLRDDRFFLDGYGGEDYYFRLLGSLGGLPVYTVGKHELRAWAKGTKRIYRPGAAR